MKKCLQERLQFQPHHLITFYGLPGLYWGTNADAPA